MEIHVAMTAAAWAGLGGGLGGGGLGAGWARVEINVAMTVNFVVYSAMGPVRRRRRPASSRSVRGGSYLLRHGRIWEGC